MTINPKTTAAIGEHPLHPMLIPSPIAFFVATSVCDLVFWQTENAAWATAATWLLGAGIGQVHSERGTSVMGDHGTRWDGPFEELGSVDQDLVAEAMAVAVVDLLEVIKRHHQVGGPHSPISLLLEKALGVVLIGQARELVGERGSATFAVSAGPL